MRDPDGPSLDDHELPPSVAEQLEISLGLGEAPATLAQWVDETVDVLGPEYLPADPEALCVTESSRHEARVDGTTRHYRCFLDVLLLPFVQEDPAPVRFRSHSPVQGSVVEGTVTRTAVSAEPGTAVVSFGAATDVVSAAYLDVPSALAVDRFCPYVQAFPDEAAYERWASRTGDGVTTPIPLEVAFALARRLLAR